MSAYFVECCKDHVDSMKSRELALEKTILKYTSQLEVLRDERSDLEHGIINWEEEEANQ